MSYALARHPSGRAEQTLVRAVGLLEAHAVWRDGGVTWEAFPGQTAWLSVVQGGPAPQRLFNLGVAHGVPGLLLPLAGLVHKGIAAERAEPLLAGLIRWIHAQRLSDPATAQEGVYPYAVGEGLKSIAARPAWCYGDPALAVVFAATASQLGDAALGEDAVTLARAAARQASAARSVHDAFLCHGTSGLAHIFHRLFRSAGDPALRSCALSFLDQTLDRMESGREVAAPAATVLETDLGVALCLLSAIGVAASSWDCFLGLSVGPSAR